MGDANPVKTLQYDIPLDNDGTITINITEPMISAENLGLSTWGSSIALASRLHSVKPEALQTGSPLQVLELGAGTGLVGLSAAPIWQADVLLTDLEPIVPALHVNIRLNKSVLHSGRGSARCGCLDWSIPDDLRLSASGSAPNQPTTIHPDENKMDIILAADVIYWEEHPAMLATTILLWLKRSNNARLLLLYPLRIAYLDQIRELWQLLEAGGLRSVEEEKIAVPGDIDDELEFSIWQWEETDVLLHGPARRL